MRNIVFMGMGEPFHNEAGLYETLEALAHVECFDHGFRQISVSTVGIPDAMVRCAERFPRLRIALSLHSAQEETRQRIIPLARRYSLDVLRDAVAEVTRIQEDEVLDHLIEVLIEHGHHIGGPNGLGEAGESANVREHDRDLSLLTATLE